MFKITTKTGAPCLAVETWVYTASSTAKSLPRTTELGDCCWNELEAVFLGLLSKFLLYSLMVLQFLLGEDGFVVGCFVVSRWKTMRASLWAAAVMALGAPSLVRILR